MGFNGLSRYPLLTFALACLMVYFAVTRYKKDRKVFIAIYFILSIEGLLITVARLNNIYFTLPKQIVFFMDIVIFAGFAIFIVLLAYSAFTNKENPEKRKLAYVGLGLMLVAIIALSFVILFRMGIL